MTGRIQLLTAMVIHVIVGWALPCRIFGQVVEGLLATDPQVDGHEDGEVKGNFIIPEGKTQHHSTKY